MLYYFPWNSACILMLYTSQAKQQTFIVLLNYKKCHVERVWLFPYSTFTQALGDFL